MTKKNLSIIFVIFMFIFCLIFFVPHNRYFRIQEVLSPTEFIFDNGQYFKIDGIETFDSRFTARNKEIAKNLNITELYQGQKFKLPALEELKEKYNLSYDEISYMGDDLPDICCLEKVGLACCPKDAVDEVKEIAHFVSSKDGGRGAVRELCDLILDAQGIKKEFTVCEGKIKG